MSAALLTFTTLSPFRYPGGKSWLRKKILQQVAKNNAAHKGLFVEPFAGGASVALAVAEMGLAQRVLMVERDSDVAAVWQAILGKDSARLKRRISDFRITRRNVERELERNDGGKVNVAFRCLLRNRVQRGGILAPGAGLLRSGEAGRGIASRWYPETLIQRIERIHAMRGKIRFLRGDAFKVIEDYSNDSEATFFVDPPYTPNGNGPGTRLYRYSEIDHERLFELTSSTSATVFLTYHDCPEIRRMANRYRFSVKLLPMRTTHHEHRAELLLTKVRV